MADNVLFVFDAAAINEYTADAGLIAYRPVCLFDDTNQETIILPSVRVPELYAGGTLKAIVDYCMVGANTSDEVVCYVSGEALTDGDADVDDWDGDSANYIEHPVPDTAYEWDTFEVTLTNDDGVEVGDLLTLMLGRLGDFGHDTAAGDMAVKCITLVEVEA